MGELTVSVKIPIPGTDQNIELAARLCKNLNCGLYFFPTRKNHEYHSKECKDVWINKTRPLQGIAESSVKSQSAEKRQ